MAAGLSFLLLLALSQAASPASPGNPSYQEANKLFIAKRFPQCQAALEAALSLDPKLVPALTLKAKLAMTMNRFDVARESLDRALAAEPNSASVHFLYGLQFYLTNNLEAAMPHFQAARRFNPTDARSTLYLGLTVESLGRTQEALMLYRDAARMDQAAPTGPQAETLLAGARLLLILGKMDEAENWISSALKADPNLRDAHFERARMLLQKGNPTLAVAEGETALRLSEGSVKDAQIHFLLSRAYQRKGMPDQAAAHAEIVRALQTPVQQ